MAPSRQDVLDGGIFCFNGCNGIAAQRQADWRVGGIGELDNDLRQLIRVAWLNMVKIRYTVTSRPYRTGVIFNVCSAHCER